MFGIAEDLQLEKIIESAKDAMGIDDCSRVFSSDILRLELSGPEQPHLTLVDLPGLFQAGNRSQSDADSETVKSLVLSYMRSPRSIILAVVSAKNDFNNQSITKLSKILKDHIVAQLPDVLTQIKSGIQECTERLEKLGASRATAQEQRRYLLQVSQSFSTLVRAAIDGQYLDSFFGDASTPEGYHKRLRAVLQNTLIDFAEDMRKKGHTYTITDGDPTTLPFHISRSDYVAKVTRLLKRSRGRELLGTFDPLIVGQLFHKQREPWAKLVDQYLEIILRAVYFLAHTALAHVCDQSTLTGLSRQFIYIRLERLTAELRNKVTELLKPHDAGHPITYNHYLTENV
ncbi:Interferon-induced GTP-binding protein Mx protein [Pyrenophora tritici-repentis]|nr:Interferon-induced GTP-binding protein Mx protein [Pyrenophora tritici-repentis]